MEYRDERDALRARVESLEAEIATARAELERMNATEAALEASKNGAQRLRAEIARMRPGAPPGAGKPSVAWLVLVPVAAAMGIGFGALIFARPRVAPPPPPLPVAQTPEPTPPPKVDPPEPAKVPEPAAPARSVRTAHVEWTATVKSTQGAGPAPGTSCKILGDLSGDGASTHLDDLEVVCGAKFLYRATDHFNGMANRSSGVSEIPGKDAALRYAVILQDQGTRTGRAQISLDTNQKSAVVWSENVPTFRVELTTAPLSEPRTGEPLLDAEHRLERLAEAIVRSGSVSSVEGNPGVSAGAQCTVDVSPASTGDSNCRVRVRCGGKVVYGNGGSGYNKCTIKEGRLGRLEDPRPSSQDSDPQLDMDLAENTVVVRDSGDTSWKISVALSPAGK